MTEAEALRLHLWWLAYNITVAAGLNKARGHGWWEGTGYHRDNP